MSLVSTMSHKGQTASEAVVIAGLQAMRGAFTNMDVAAAMGRAGFVPHDLWTRQELANRLLQRARKRDLITYDNKFWHATPALSLTLEADINALEG